MVGFDEISSSSCRGSKQELHSSLLQESGGFKKETDATMVGGAAMVRGGKQCIFSDGAPWGDGSESKEVLIGTNMLGKPSTMPMPMSKIDLFLSSSEDPLGEDKMEMYVQVENSAHPAAKDDGGSPSITSTTKDSSLTSTHNTNNDKNSSPTYVAALSLKRLESFRFPLRKSPIEKGSIARPRLYYHHHHHRSHHHSLPYNTVTATYTHHLSKAASALHQPLATSDLVLPGHCPTLRVNTTLNAASATMAVASASTLSGNTQPRQSPLNTNGASLSPTTPEGSNEPGFSDINRQHDFRWVSERYRRQMGQQRLLRRSESCSYISHHHPSLSFNSSKKALLSLQARRVNKPDAKVHLLPEILTTANTTTTSTLGPAAPALLRKVDMRLEVEGDEPLPGLETPVATAVLLNTARTASTPSQVLRCENLLLTIAPKAATKFTATAGMASPVVESPQANTDYQLRVKEQDRIVIDKILTEFSIPEDFPSETKIAIDGNDVDEGEKSQKAVPAHENASKLEQATDSTATAPVVVLESTSEEAPLSLSETNLSTAMTAFTIESGPTMDAGEIKRFVKRSHALQELEATEQSYVNDLDVLVHVSS